MTAPRCAALTIDTEFPTSWKDKTAAEQCARLIDLSLERCFPLTWLVKVSAEAPRAVAEHFFSLVAPRLPPTHEIGLHVHFDDEDRENYIREPAERAALIEAGCAILRDFHVQPKTFRAGCCRVETSDLPVLARNGILVESSVMPGVPGTKDLADWQGVAHTQPYHPDPADIRTEGNSPIIEVPILTNGRTAMFMDRWQTTEEALDILRQTVDRGDRYLCILGHDGSVNLDSVRRCIEVLRREKIPMVTLSGLAAKWRSGAVSAAPYRV